MRPFFFFNFQRLVGSNFNLSSLDNLSSSVYLIFISKGRDLFDLKPIRPACYAPIYCPFIFKYSLYSCVLHTHRRSQVYGSSLPFSLKAPLHTRSTGQFCLLINYHLCSSSTIETKENFLYTCLHSIIHLHQLQQ